VIPTGVTHIVAAVIQLALALLGARGLMEAGFEGLKHGSQWLTIAWTAKGDIEKIAEESRVI